MQTMPSQLSETRSWPFFCSWSGGKDACLSLYRSVQKGGIPRSLLTMLIESGDRTRAHGLPVAIIQRQAAAMNLPVIFRSASWSSYETEFVSALHEFKSGGIEAGVFGDIDLEEHLFWVQRVCGSASIRAIHPLWKEDRRLLIHEFMNSGFAATLVTVKEGALDPELLGEPLTPALVERFERLGIDPSGENGEYHTVVTDGPIFASPLRLHKRDKHFRDGYWFLDISLEEE